MKTLLKALADFQQEAPVIHKDTSGYNYSYADLPKILEEINPLLKKYKLGFSQPLVGNKIKTIIFHTETGELLESETDLPINSLQYIKTVRIVKGETKEAFVIPGFESMNMAQATGSLITYFRRYALSSILGLVTDKDTDGTSKVKGSKEDSDTPF